MTPDGLMIGAQGPALQVSLVGKGMIWAAEGSQLPGGEDPRWGLCASAGSSEPPDRTQLPGLFSPPSLPFFSFSYYPSTEPASTRPRSLGHKHMTHYKLFQPRPP